MIHSYSSIHQIFYPNKKFGPEEISQLQKYCLVNKLLQKIEESKSSKLSEKITPQKIEESKSSKLSEKEILQKIEGPKKPEKITPQKRKIEIAKIEIKNPENREVQPRKSEVINSEKPKFWIPTKPDTLFWSIFISENGFSEFHQIGHSYGNRILEEKLKIAKWIKESPKSLKTSNHKFTNESIQETIAEFMVDQIISFKGVAALAIYYKRPIYIIHEQRKIYLKFRSGQQEHTNEETPIYVYYHNIMRGEHKYKICNNEYIPSLDNLYCLESDKKPLKTIGHYKVEDLYDICSKLDIDPPLKIKKAELYQLITDKSSWYLTV